MCSVEICLLPIHKATTATMQFTPGKSFSTFSSHSKSLSLVKFKEIQFKTALVLLKIFLCHPTTVYDFAQSYAKDVNGNLLVSDFFFNVRKMKKCKDFAEEAFGYSRAL